MRNFAELLLIKEAQASLKKHKYFAMWKKQMRVFTDENGILRCQGRIDIVLSLPYATKHPVLLPNDHCLTALYIKRAHARVLHNGVKDTLTELRSQFWVMMGTNVVKRILSECYLCRRHEGRSYFVSPPPPLPAFRIQESPPFTSTGGILLDHCMSRVQVEVSIRCGMCCTHVVLPEPYNWM